MRRPSYDSPLERGELSSAISDAVVAVVRDYTGRGPTEARTTVDDHLVVCVLGNSLTKGERSLVASGEQQVVLEMRQSYQSAMREDMVGAVEGLTHREVVAFMSANHLHPDLAVETFLLEPLAGERAR